MAYAINTFEGGTDLVAVTTGNSGGRSGHAWNETNTPATSTLAYDLTAPAHGGLALAVATAGTGANPYVGWTTQVGTITDNLYGRAYIYQATGTTTLRWFQALSGASGRGALTITSGGKIQTLRTGGALVQTSTMNLATSTLYRIEWRFVLSATVGQIICSIYLGDSTTPSETMTSAATQNMGGTSADGYRFGSTTTISNAGPLYMDDIAISSDGLLGPYKASMTPRAPRRVRTGLGELLQV